MSRSRHRRPARPPAGRQADATPITLRLDRLSSGGDAVAVRDDGKTIFVEGGVPGDLVRVRIEREKSRWARGRVVEVLEPSAQRVEPVCRHFGVCGGCAWQHVSYAAQIEAKAAILRDALERIGGLELAAPLRVTASPSAYGYRGRARILVRDGRPGYRERASDRHTAVEECSVLAPELEAAVRDWQDHSAPSESGIRVDSSGQEWALCVGRDGAVSKSLVRSSEEPPPDAMQGVLPAPPPLRVELEVEGSVVGIDAIAFSQANRLLHGTLVRRVLDVLLDGADPVTSASWRVLEVHAGVGFFTLPLAKRVSSVVAVEAEPHAVELLRQNLASAEAGLGPVEVIEGFFGDAEGAALDAGFDAVLLDPPRTGLTSSEIDRLVALDVPRIVYLSCDPATLARDVRALGEAGWACMHVEGFDLFPQTPHTEGLVRLERSRQE